MAQLNEYPWEISYSTSDIRADGSAVDVLHDFYLPALARSTAYDRVAGYFSSSSLAAASRGFSQFVGRDGAARFIVGTDLDADDAEAILQGDRDRAAMRLDERLGQEDQWPEETARGVALLAWMVAHDYLTVRVAIRVHGDAGTAQTMNYVGDGYVHEKWAVFSDGRDALLASGSLNESRTALQLNAENLDIFTSWEGRGAERIANKRQSFDAMWEDRHPYIRVFDLPDAIRLRLVQVAERCRHLIEVDGTGATDELDSNRVHLTPEERLKFALIRLAPLLPGGEHVGMETAPIEPWPHQRFVARRLIESYPDNHLLCDEVGLGKTIEAGLAFRSLWLAGRATSIRVFAPASLTSQWLHEMAEKFLLPFRRRTDRQGRYETVAPATGSITRGRSELFDYPLEIISTGLLVHGSEPRFLADMGTTDIVLLDEAHKARRRSPDQTSREARYNNLYRAIERFLLPQSESLLLATATPMQINRVEAFDLLRFMYSSGAVRLSADLCNAYYELREQLVEQQRPEPYQLDFLVRYLADARRTAPQQWQFVHDDYVFGVDLMRRGDFDNLVDFGSSPMEWRGLQPALTMLSPLGRAMLRHTRELLRVYQKEGLLNANLAERRVEPVVVKLPDRERELYDALQAYCEELARRVRSGQSDNHQRAAIGFYLSFLRQRFSSSFQALIKSFERRLDKIGKTLAHHAEQESYLLGDEGGDDLTEDELTGLILKNRTPADLTWEQGTVARLLKQLRAYRQTPRKTQELLTLIGNRQDRRTRRVRQLVIFTRYGDTLHYLYDELAARLPDCPLATFSGEGGRLRMPGATVAQALDRTKVRQQFVDGRVDILLCTDAAAEGLNLQSADLLINFDLPWNPMLLEQRIGRIDRIGQQHQQITACNFLYQNSVEEVIYKRLVDRFKDAVSVTGALQFSLLPIEEKDFQDYAKTPEEEGAIDWEELLARANAHRERMDERRRLTEFSPVQQKEAYQTLAREADRKRPPITLEQIWETLRDSTALRALGCRVLKFEHGEAMEIRGIPELEGQLLTCSRRLYEHGLPDEQDGVLHFATYGDTVFERLLDYFLTDEDEIARAWESRQPLASVNMGSLRAERFPDEVGQYMPEEKPLITVSLRTTHRTQAPKAGESGKRHHALVTATAVALARSKLRAQPASPAQHLQRLDKFIRDVHERPKPYCQLPLALADKASFVAQSEQLIWPVVDYGRRLFADPILLGVCRDLIERALNEVPANRSTNEGVVERLEKGSARVLP